MNVLQFHAVDLAQEVEAAVAEGDDALRSNHPEAIALALKIFDLTLRIRSDHPALLFRRALALTYLGRADDAIETYGRALALKFDHAEFEARFRAGRAELLIQVGRFAEALDDSKRAVELCPDVPEVLLGHARVLAFNKQGDAAIDVYDDIIDRQKTLNFEHAPVGIGPIILERDAIVRLFLESDVA
jgi:tetratricopeptide (TPR) repeat protein